MRAASLSVSEAGRLTGSDAVCGAGTRGTSAGTLRVSGAGSLSSFEGDSFLLLERSSWGSSPARTNGTEVRRTSVVLSLSTFALWRASLSSELVV